MIHRPSSARPSSTNDAACADGAFLTVCEQVDCVDDSVNKSPDKQGEGALADEAKKGKIERAVKKAIAAVVPPPFASDQAAKGRSPSRICSGCRDGGGGEIAPGFAMLSRAKRASHIDPPASSYAIAIMRWARPYRGENPRPGKDHRTRA
jgi:hypothetical protein